jgi:hypothetical protein
MNYVGIDHHRQYSHMPLMDQEGQTIRSGRVPNVRVEIEKFLEGIEAVEAVIETGRSSYTLGPPVPDPLFHGLGRQRAYAQSHRGHEERGTFPEVFPEVSPQPQDSGTRRALPRLWQQMHRWAEISSETSEIS